MTVVIYHLNNSIERNIVKAYAWIEKKGDIMLTSANRFTKALNIRHPIVSAPMAFAGGGALAAAVSRAGGLGLIGGGYGDPAWLETQFEAARGQAVGVGFITWALRK